MIKLNSIQHDRVQYASTKEVAGNYKRLCRNELDVLEVQLLSPSSVP